VNSIREFLRSAWIKARLTSPSFVNRAIEPYLHEGKEIVRLLSQPHLPIYELQGQGQGGPLSVTYVGLNLAKPYLKSILFEEDPVEREVGQAPFWRTDRLVDGLPGDIVIVEAYQRLIHRLPRQNALVLPHYVFPILDVRGDWQDVRSRLFKTVRTHELRLVRKHGYTYRVSHDPQDFEEFYHQMYWPTMDGRHGELSSPMSIAKAHQYFQHGWLFRVERDDEWVSGLICYLQQNTVIAQIMGVRDADTQLMRDGAASTLYYTAVHWANQNGYEAVNFLGTEPFLDAGQFRYKRKWGTAMSIPPQLHRRIWLKVQRVTPAVSTFLQENPCIVVDDRRKELYGLIVVDDLDSVTTDTKERWEERYTTLGLSHLAVRSVNDFAEGLLDDHGPDLVIPIASTSSSKSAHDTQNKSRS